MSESLAEFIHRQNLRHYNKELSIAANGPRKTMLLSLLARECARAHKAGITLVD